MVTEEELEKLEQALEKLEPGVNEYIERRINHIPFAKLIFWLHTQYKKGHDFIYVRDLAKYMKITPNRAYEILNGLSEVNIMKKKIKDSVNEYWFETNGNIPVIEKYLERAKKTLGLI